MSEEENNINIKSNEELPLYDRPGRLNPDRHVPITRFDRVDVNVHYDEAQKTFINDSDSPEFTEQSANAMDPFEDTALLKGDIKPKSSGVKTGAGKFESKIFVPETTEEKVVVKEPVKEEPQPVYVNEEDSAASQDFIADAMSGVDDSSPVPKAALAFSIVDPSRLKTFAYLLGILIVVELLGIVLMILL